MASAAVGRGRDYRRHLAQLYREAVDELARHGAADDGICEGCGELYPCPQEWITARAVSGIETRWRREAKRPDAASQAQADGPVAVGDDGDGVPGGPVTVTG